MLNAVVLPLDVVSRLESRHLKLISVLLSYADRNGRCWPSLRTIAKTAGETLGWVQRNLSEMQSLGYFTRQRKLGSYVYQLAAKFFQKPRRLASESPLKAAAGNVKRDLPTAPADSPASHKEEKDSQVIDSKGGLGRRFAPPRGPRPENLKAHIKQLLLMKLQRYLMARGRPGELGRFATVMMEGGEAAQRAFDAVNARRKAEGWDDRDEQRGAIYA